MKVFSTEKSKLIDKLTIDEGVPSILLMENAAFAVLDRIEKNLSQEASITLVCGKGNNGGDGFALARLLFLRNYRVRVILCGDKNDLQGDAKVNYDILIKMGLEIIYTEENLENHVEIKSIIENSDLIVDAIFGIGFRGSLNYDMIKLVNIVNNYSKYIISIDIATGINTNTGEVSLAVKADETVTFGFLKPGHLLYPGHIYSGKIYTYDIGFLDSIVDQIETNYFYLTEEEAFSKLPKREIRSNKGTFGKSMVIAGSSNMSGALLLSSLAVYKSGGGYVYAASVPSATDKLKSFLPEALTIPANEEVLDINFYDKIKNIIYQMDVIAMGPGLGIDKSTEGLVFRILKNINCPLVLDADALNIAGKNLNVLKDIKLPVVITPHPGEMSRLTGIPIPEILNNPIKVAREFSRRYGVVTVLKDSRTIVSDEYGNIYINTTGNPALAKAGSGDVLTGIITGLISQGLEAFEAACLGVYFHGRAGDLAVKDLGDYGVLARDINSYIFK